MALCPNINSPEWKQLVAAQGQGGMPTGDMNESAPAPSIIDPTA